MLRLAILGSMGFLLLTGCSDQFAGRHAVSGTVTLSGQPLSDATVIFEPMDNQDTGTSAAIRDGKYEVERSAGLKPGKYRVRITAGDGVTPDNPIDPEAGPGPGGRGNTNIISKERVPRDWNVNSNQEVTVTADGPNEFNFTIP